MIAETNNWDVVCNACIEIMQGMTELTGLSYGAVNVWLFIILGPLSTILMGAATLLAYTKHYKISAVCFSLGVLIALFICFAVIYTLSAILVCVHADGMN